MEAALKSRYFSDAELSKASAELIAFCVKLIEKEKKSQSSKIMILDPISKGLKVLMNILRKKTFLT